MQEQRPNTILGSSSYEEHYDILPPVNATARPFSNSSLVGMEIQQGVIGVPNPMFHKNYVPCTNSTMLEPRGFPEYTCDHCKKTFYNSHAFGGHMSSHSKATSKILHTEENNATLVPSRKK
jgi:hypothetical protein